MQGKPHSAFYQTVRALLRNKFSLCGLIMLGIAIVLAVLAPWISPQNPYDLSQLDIMDGRLTPGTASMSGMTYWLGTDDQGRDLLSAILYGTRTSLLVGVSSALIALTIGAAAGLI
ncbi:MAG: ABC transporter permease, partial [Pseudomonas sp.]